MMSGKYDMDILRELSRTEEEAMKELVQMFQVGMAPKFQKPRRVIWYTLRFSIPLRYCRNERMTIFGHHHRQTPPPPN